jgi:hypothetical protein
VASRQAETINAETTKPELSKFIRKGKQKTIARIAAIGALALSLCTPVLNSQTEAPKDSNMAGINVILRPQQHRFTGAKGSWSVVNSKSDQYTIAQWLGIGGIDGGTNANELVQVGTTCASMWDGCRIFYEILPQRPFIYDSIIVKPNDIISAEMKISLVKANQWYIKVTDITQKASFKRSLDYSSSRSSVELVLETPEIRASESAKRWSILGLTDFDDVRFFNFGIDVNSKEAANALDYRKYEIVRDGRRLTRIASNPDGSFNVKRVR